MTTLAHADAVTALRTGIDPNVLAAANLARRIPVAVSARAADADNGPVRAAVSRL